MKYAAIDIGSNAIRLLIVNVYSKHGVLSYKKDSLIRLPIRLGSDVFTKNIISDAQEKRLTNAIIAFKYLMKVHDVKKFRACATSAFREAANGEEIIARIKKKTNIQIDLITGKEEAKIIYSNYLQNILNNQTNVLYIDVGGGSTEVSLFEKGKLLASTSFKIGTVRILEDKLDKNSWDTLEKWIIKYTNDLNIDYVIGSGGNINKLAKIINEREGEVQKMISFFQLNEVYQFILGHTYQQRIKDLGLNPDRADVIIPAAEIFLKIMRWGNITQVFVPKIGLSDGIIMDLSKKSKV